jgi:hypothetical protein
MSESGLVDIDLIGESSQTLENRKSVIFLSDLRNDFIGSTIEQ